MRTFNLTFSQAKEAVNTLGRDEVEGHLEKLNDQPDFLKFMGEIEDVAELIAIYDGGCASGAYMPAVTYYTANQCMAGDASGSVEEELEAYGFEITFNPAQDSWQTFAAKLCAAAVESYVSGFSELIEVLRTCDY